MGSKVGSLSAYFHRFHQQWQRNNIKQREYPLTKGNVLIQWPWPKILVFDKVPKIGPDADEFWADVVVWLVGKILCGW
jgi:hypothetical protein